MTLFKPTTLIAAFLFTGLAAEVEARHITCSPNTVIGRASKATPFAILTRRGAISLARKDWVNGCLIAFGDPWCTIARSIGRDSRTTRVPNGLGGYNYESVFKARPCKRR